MREEEGLKEKRGGGWWMMEEEDLKMEMTMGAAEALQRCVWPLTRSYDFAVYG